MMSCRSASDAFDGRACRHAFAVTAATGRDPVTNLQQLAC
tara:strand:- start:905 stop:1024 length:120 start_codon:yes stop_codon:yes gene_type:complete